MLKITEHFHIPYPFQLKITAASYHSLTALLSSVHFVLGLQKNNYYFSKKCPRFGFFFFNYFIYLIFFGKVVMTNKEKKQTLKINN